MNPEVNEGTTNEHLERSPTHPEMESFSRTAGHFHRFVERASPRLLSLATWMTRDRHAAEDLVQESLTSIFRQPEFSPDHPGAYAYAATIVRRKCFSYLTDPGLKGGLIRGAGGWDSNSRLEWALPRDEVTPVDILQTTEKREVVVRLVDTLKPDDARRLRQRYLEGLRESDLAAEEGIPYETWKSRLRTS